MKRISGLAIAAVALLLAFSIGQTPASAEEHGQVMAPCQITSVLVRAQPWKLVNGSGAYELIAGAYTSNCVEQDINAVAYAVAGTPTACNLHVSIPTTNFAYCQSYPTGVAVAGATITIHVQIAAVGLDGSRVVRTFTCSKVYGDSSYC